MTSDPEITLEELKRINNAKCNYLKRLSDQRPIWELYAAGEADLHIHFAMDGMFCATYTALNGGESGASTGIANGANFAGYVGQLPVFVPIAGVTEKRRPLASIVRLKHLNLCEMRGVDALEPGIFASLKALFLCFDGASEVITNLTNQNSCANVNCGRVDWVSNFEYVRGITVEITGDCVLAAQNEFGDVLGEVSKMFLCPSNPSNRLITSRYKTKKGKRHETRNISAPDASRANRKLRDD